MRPWHALVGVQIQGLEGLALGLLLLPRPLFRVCPVSELSVDAVWSLKDAICHVGYSIAWLEPSDARSVYYVQSLSSVSLVVIGYLYGGFLSDKTVTAYHALLIVYLSMGNVISGVFPLCQNQNTLTPLRYRITPCKLRWLSTWVYSSKR
jgi:hypothetical protein